MSANRSLPLLLGWARQYGTAVVGTSIPWMLLRSSDQRDHARALMWEHEARRDAKWEVRVLEARMDEQRAALRRVTAATSPA